MGRIGRSLSLGLKSLLLHKLRSGLTILGIVIGVAAVIVMTAVSEGKSRDAMARIEKLGATNIIYRSVKPSDEAQSAGGTTARILNYGLKYEDYERIMETVPTIRRVLPIREIRKEIRRLHNVLDGRVVGTTHDYADFNHLEIARGRFLTASDEANYDNVAVLAAQTCETLFLPYEDPIGQSIKLGTDYYTVVGVTKSSKEDSSAVAGGNQGPQGFNKDVYIPLSTCRIRFGDRLINARSGSFEAEETELSQITMQVANRDQVIPTSQIVEDAVKRFHKKTDVLMTVPYELLRTAQMEQLKSLLLLVAIALTSMIVGGIGIMNIMLATVTERTREIGIRRALGAKRRDITQQFLIESIVLSGVGGLIGVVIGVGTSVGLATDWWGAATRIMETVVMWQWVVAAFAVSVVIGVVFGIYPAYRAARMDPIEALRHE